MSKSKWVLDPTHSELGFRIKHLMITHVSGNFKDFSVNAEMNDDDLTTAKIHVTVQMESINTNNEQRDAHLRNSDFFEVPTYPQLEFNSTRIRKKTDEEYELTGDLTMKGITQPVTLQIEYGGITKDPWGNERAGFSLTGKFNRKDWGVNFNMVLETGNVGLGEEVKLQSEIQLVKVVEAVPA